MTISKAARAAAAAKKAAATSCQHPAAPPAKPAAASSPKAPSIITESKAKFVTVASKLTMSFEMQLAMPRTARETGQFGSVESTVYIKQGMIHVIRGTGYPEGKPPKGFPKRPDFIEDENGGYALTPGVPAEFWNAWKEQNKDTEMVLNGLVKAQTDLDSLAADAAEHAHVDSGLGPLNPDNDRDGNPLDRRNPRPATAGVSNVKQEARTTA